MKRNYAAFRTFAPDLAIDDLIELAKQRKKASVSSKKQAVSH